MTGLVSLTEEICNRNVNYLGGWDLDRTEDGLGKLIRRDRHFNDAICICSF